MIREFKTRMGNKKIEMIIRDAAEIPVTVYKYRDWKNDFHKNMIILQEIFIPSPRLFNDPFDCRIPIAYHLMKDNPELANSYFSAFVTKGKRYRGYTKSQKADEVKRLINEGRYKDVDYIASKNNESIEKLHDDLGVFSVTAVNDNTLMWSHYANSHQGFCVGFDSMKLFDIFGHGDIVDYQRDYPIVNPLENDDAQWTKQIFTKAEYWDYEIEYRLTKFGFANVKRCIPKDVFTEVILGHRMSESEKKVILKIINSELPHVKVFMAMPIVNSFELELFRV